MSRLYYDTPALRARIPKEGPRTCPIVIPFSDGDSFDINVLLTRRLGFLSLVATLFVNNSGSNVHVDFITAIINQRLSVPAFCMAYLPLLCPQESAITAQSTGGVDVPIDLINVPMPALVWSATQPPPVIADARIISSGNYRTINIGNFRTID